MRFTSKTMSIKQGDRFGQLVIVKAPYCVKRNGRAIWLCVAKCDCGVTREMWAVYLLDGKTITCGSHNREGLLPCSATHRESKTRLYKTWAGVVKRCEDTKSTRYKHYGARGITVDANWRADYTVFRDWALANGYRDDLTIERMDNDRGYCPDNCKWIPASQQPNNRTISHWITAFGETRTLVDWTKDARCRVTNMTIAHRIKSGMSPELAITTAPKTGKHKKTYTP